MKFAFHLLSYLTLFGTANIASSEVSSIEKELEKVEAGIKQLKEIILRDPKNVVHRSNLRRLVDLVGFHFGEGWDGQVGLSMDFDNLDGREAVDILGCVKNCMEDDEGGDKTECEKYLDEYSGLSVDAAYYMCNVEHNGEFLTAQTLIACDESPPGVPDAYTCLTDVCSMYELEMYYNKKALDYVGDSYDNCSASVFLIPYDKTGPTLELPDIIDLAEQDGNFKTLLAALDAADLTSLFREPLDRFTVLAPNDEAFAKLPPGILECLLMPQFKDVLVDILSYHAYHGIIYSEWVYDGMTIKMMNGDETIINIEDEEVTVNDGVTFAEDGVDIEASNGLINILNGVLVPPDMNIMEIYNKCYM